MCCHSRPRILAATSQKWTGECEAQHMVKIIVSGPCPLVHRAVAPFRAHGCYNPLDISKMEGDKTTHIGITTNGIECPK